MLAVNLGTRGVQEALELQEYANHPAGTDLADRRIGHGDKDPFGVRLWCLGNEMDGPWQIGAKDADEYGRLAAQTARAMRMIDPDLELVACGSSSQSMPTFAAWEATVLQHTYDVVDYISMHAYYEELEGDRDSFLASAVDMESFIDNVVATCDHVAARLKSSKKINISFDEWNVWYINRFVGEKNLQWEQHPRLIEDTYSVTDAVVVGTLLNSLLRHADRVSIACLAQLVNVIAPIRSEPGGPAWRQTIYHPFALTSQFGRGTVLRTEPTSPLHDTAWQGEVPVLDSVAVLDEESGAVTLFLVNRDQATPLTLDIDLRGVGTLTAGELTTLSDTDPDAVNSAEEPDRVVPHAQGKVAVDGGRLDVVLPPLSWNMLRLT
jgi:alpha-N-arabinofuranosidase